MSEIGRARRVLIVNHYLRGFAGSEIHVLQLIDYFEKRGDEVWLAGFVLRDPFLEAARERKIRVVHVWAALRLLRSGFDVIWTHQQSGFLLTHVILGAKARLHLHGFLSYFVRLEQLPFRLNQTLPAHLKLLANSAESRDKLQGPARTPLMAVLHNLVPTSFYENLKTSHRNKVERLAIVSNHLPEELKTAANLFGAEGVAVTIFGQGGQYREIDAKTLIDFDVVITIGKTVQYALAQGIPVFVYDHFGGPGYMSRDEVEDHEYFNFSGRSKPEQHRPEEIVRLVLHGYRSALADITYFRDTVAPRYSTDVQLTSLLTDIEQESSPVLSPLARISELFRTLLRKPLIFGYTFAPGLAYRLSAKKPDLNRARRAWLSKGPSR